MNGFVCGLQNTAAPWKKRLVKFCYVRLLHKQGLIRHGPVAVLDKPSQRAVNPAVI